MITLEDSIPTKNLNYRIAEEIFYVQFNDVSFYIEDEEQENFFFNILRKLFSDIRFDKIFPLNGKENVIAESNKNIGDKKKVFIVDKDFDDLLLRVNANPNLFYLERYSIENYLFETDALVEYIVSEKPKLKRAFINQNFVLHDHLININSRLGELIYLHLLVQAKCPKLKNVTMSYERFFEYSNGQFVPKTVQFDAYKASIKTELKSADRRLTVEGQLRRVKEIVNMEDVQNCLIHIPGKYLVKMIKQIIESIFGLISRNVESFNYRLAENCSFASLNSLKVNINNYIH